MDRSGSGSEARADAQARAVDLRKAAAEARKAVAEARKAEGPARHRWPEDKLDVGENGSPLFARVGYRKLNALAASVAKQIHDEAGVHGRRILIVSEPNLTAGCTTHRAGAVARPSAGVIDSRRRGRRDDRRGLTTPAKHAVATSGVAAGVGAAPGLLPTVLQALRTKRDDPPGGPLEVKDVAVVAAVARSLRARGAEARVADMTTIPSNDVTRVLDSVARLRAGVTPDRPGVAEAEADGNGLLDVVDAFMIASTSPTRLG